MPKSKVNLNKNVIIFLIYSITLIGGLSFMFNKDIIDQITNYYIIFASGISIVVLICNNLSQFALKNLKKIPFIMTIITIIWIIICYFNGINLGIEAIKGVTNLICLLILGFTIVNINYNSEEKKSIINSVFISFFICIILGVFQYFSGINLIQYSNDLYPGILGRINSTFYIATILDKYFVIISGILFYYLIKHPRSCFYKILFILSGIGICLTFSRGGQLIFIFVSLLCLLFSLFKKQLSNILVVIITLILMLLIPGTTTSLQSGLDFVYDKIRIPTYLRIDLEEINKLFKKDESNANNNDDKQIISGKDESNANNSDDNQIISDNVTKPIENQSISYREKYKAIGVQIIKDYPFTGIGLGNYSFLYNNQNFENYISNKDVLNNLDTYMYPHNGYVQTAAEIGYIGLTLLYLTIFSYIFVIDRKYKLKMFTGFLLCLILLLSCYTEGVFHSKQYIFIFIIIYSIFCSKEKKNQNKEKYNKLYAKTFKGSKHDYFKLLEEKILNNKKSFIITANPEAFTIAQNDEEYFKMMIDNQTEIVADGIGLIKGGKILGYKLKERIPGIDIAKELFVLANQYKKKIYLFGSTKEVIKDMKKVVAKDYPQVKIIGADNGYEKDKDKVFQNIIKKKPDIVLVALGMPMQEKLIYKYLNNFEKGIFVGVGGTFDVLSGKKKRAPKIFIKLNLEWLYRILKEPKRIKRFYQNNIKFLFSINNTEE